MLNSFLILKKIIEKKKHTSVCIKGILTSNKKALMEKLCAKFSVQVVYYALMCAG